MLNSKDVFKEIKLVESEEKSFLIVAAIAKDKNKNSITKISCDIGTPLSGYVYDTQSDSYIILCNSYINLGIIPLSLKLVMNNHSNWFCRIPLPYKVIIKKLTKMQKMDLAKFASQFSDDEYTIEFIQTIL